MHRLSVLFYCVVCCLMYVLTSCTAALLGQVSLRKDEYE